MKSNNCFFFWTVSTFIAIDVITNVYFWRVFRHNTIYTYPKLGGIMTQEIRTILSNGNKCVILNLGEREINTA